MNEERFVELMEANNVKLLSEMHRFVKDEISDNNKVIQKFVKDEIKNQIADNNKALHREVIKLIDYNNEDLLYIIDQKIDKLTEKVDAINEKLELNLKAQSIKNAEFENKFEYSKTFVDSNEIRLSKLEEKIG